MKTPSPTDEAALPRMDCSQFFVDSKGKPFPLPNIGSGWKPDFTDKVLALVGVLSPEKQIALGTHIIVSAIQKQKGK